MHLIGNAKLQPEALHSEGMHYVLSSLRSSKQQDPKQHADLIAGRLGSSDVYLFLQQCAFWKQR